MISDNIKILRKQKGLSQEELAIRLNVVRQTVSKWEKGLSVPDAELLIKIAGELDVKVSVLLGESIENTEERNALAEQLSRINEQMAIRNMRSKKIWKTVIIVIVSIVVFNIMMLVLSMATTKKIYEDCSSITSVTNT